MSIDKYFLSGQEISEILDGKTNPKWYEDMLKELDKLYSVDERLHYLTIKNLPLSMISLKELEEGEE